MQIQYGALFLQFSIYQNVSAVVCYTAAKNISA